MLFITLLVTFVHCSNGKPFILCIMYDIHNTIRPIGKRDATHEENVMTMAKWFMDISNSGAGVGERNIIGLSLMARNRTNVIRSAEDSNPLTTTEATQLANTLLSERLQKHVDSDHLLNLDYALDVGQTCLGSKVTDEHKRRLLLLWLSGPRRIILPLDSTYGAMRKSLSHLILLTDNVGPAAFMDIRKTLQLVDRSSLSASMITPEVLANVTKRLVELNVGCSPGTYLPPMCEEVCRCINNRTCDDVSGMCPPTFKVATSSVQDISADDSIENEDENSNLEELSKNGIIIKVGKNCVVAMPSPTTWTDAKDICKSKQGALAGDSIIEHLSPQLIQSNWWVEKPISRVKRFSDDQTQEGFVSNYLSKYANRDFMPIKSLQQLRNARRKKLLEVERSTHSFKNDQERDNDKYFDREDDYHFLSHLLDKNHPPHSLKGLPFGIQERADKNNFELFNVFPKSRIKTVENEETWLGSNLDGINVYDKGAGYKFREQLKGFPLNFRQKNDNENNLYVSQIKPYTFKKSETSNELSPGSSLGSSQRFVPETDGLGFSSNGDKTRNPKKKLHLQNLLHPDHAIERKSSARGLKNFEIDNKKLFKSPTIAMEDIMDDEENAPPSMLREFGSSNLMPKDELGRKKLAYNAGKSVQDDLAGMEDDDDNYLLDNEMAKLDDPLDLNLEITKENQIENDKLQTKQLNKEKNLIEKLIDKKRKIQKRLQDKENELEKIKVDEKKEKVKVEKEKVKKEREKLKTAMVKIEDAKEEIEKEKEKVEGEKEELDGEKKQLEEERDNVESGEDDVKDVNDAELDKENKKIKAEKKVLEKEIQKLKGTASESKKSDCYLLGPKGSIETRDCEELHHFLCQLNCKRAFRQGPQRAIKINLQVDLNVKNGVTSEGKMLESAILSPSQN